MRNRPSSASKRPCFERIEPVSVRPPKPLDILEAILRGDEPSGLSLAKLTGRLPLLWSEQRKKFGFQAR